jgi:hypothetical protein
LQLKQRSSNVIDPEMSALYQKTVALNQIAESLQRAFLDAGCQWAGDGPVATRIGEQMRTALLHGEIASCGHRASPAVWLPTAPALLRCEACYAEAWLEARLQCAGCEKAITLGGPFVGIIPAQVASVSRLIMGPWLLTYTLCTDCQREDGAIAH